MEYREGTPDCTLELELGHFVVESNQPARPRNATPDWPFPHHTYPFMLGRKWGDDSVCSTDPEKMKPAESLKAVTVGRKASDTKWQDKLVEAYATIMLDRKSDAREFHKIYFTAEQWDRIAADVHIGEKVILEGCTIRFDPKDEPVVVDTEKDYDYGDGGGFSTGTFKRYIPGVVTDVADISIARRLQMSDAAEGKVESRQSPLLVLENFDEMLYEAMSPADIESDYGGHDESEPRLSDYYDDLEELELNTRGDGYD